MLAIGHKMSITPQEALEDETMEQFIKEIEEGDRPKIETFEDIQKLLWKNIPDTIYHYTTPEGLDGILDSNCFWLTDSDFLNDDSEFQYSVDLLDRIIKELLSKDSNNKFLNSINKIFEGKEDGFSLFGGSYAITSFSHDDDILSQFMVYANHCSGYSLGINTTSLLANCHVINEDKNQNFKGSQNGFDFGTEIKPNFEFFHIGKVVYNQIDQEKLIKILLAEGEKKYTFGLGDISLNIELFLDDIKPYLLLMKNPVFSAEEEFRIICWMTVSLKLNNRVVNNIPIPYLKLASNHDEVMPIKSITVGSKIDYPLAKLSFNKFEIYNKLNKTEINKSKLPIR